MATAPQATAPKTAVLRLRGKIETLQRNVASSTAVDAASPAFGRYILDEIDSGIALEVFQDALESVTSIEESGTVQGVIESYERQLLSMACGREESADPITNLKDRARLRAVGVLVTALKGYS